jgi:putative endonuclease
MREPAYYVYVLTNARHNVLYSGVTNDLTRRVSEHREGRIPGFTSRYNVTKLVYYETFADAGAAIAREKQIKAGSRKRKIRLIDAANPRWRDLWPEISQ